MRGRPYGVDYRRRSPSPRRPPPRSRDFSPSRRRKFSPYNGRGMEEYSREAKSSRRGEKRDYLDRDSSLRDSRFSEYGNRDGDRYVVDDRGFRSPRRLEKKDNFDRPVRLPDFGDGDSRLSEYGNRNGDRYAVDDRGFRSPRRMEKKDNFDRPVCLPDFGVGHSKRSYNEDLYHCDVSTGVGHSKRSYDEDLYHGDASTRKFQGDLLLDGPRKPDYFSGVGVTDITRGGERDYYRQDRTLDSGRVGLLSSPQYLDSAKPAPVEYEGGGRVYSRPYVLGHGGDDNIPLRNIGGAGSDGSGHMSSVASRYLNTDIDKQSYLHSRDDLLVERRDGLRDRNGNYFEKKTDGFHSGDRLLGVERTAERETYKFKMEDELLSSRSYMRGGSDYTTLSSLPKDYDPVPSSETLREGFPGYSTTRDLHMSSDMIGWGNGLASEPIGLRDYSEKRENMFPRGPGGKLDETRSSPSSYIRLPEERQEDRAYTEFGRSNMDKYSSRLNDAEFGRRNMDSISSRLHDGEEGYRDQYMSRDVLSHTVDDFSQQKHVGDVGLLDHYPSSRLQSTPGKLDGRESLHGRQQGADMLGTTGSRLNYGAQSYDGYEGLKSEEHHADVAGVQRSQFETSGFLQSRGHGPSFGRPDDSPRRRLPVADSALVEPSEWWLRDTHVRDEILYEKDIGIRISTDENGARKIYNHVSLEGDIDPVNFSEKPRSSRLDYEKSWRVSSEMANDQPSSSKFQPHRSVKSRKSDSRDIKKRLGPIRQKLHVSQRLVNKHKPSIKKRLAPASSTKRGTHPPHPLPWLKNRNPNKKASNQNDLDGGPPLHDGDKLGDNLPLANSEPPEKSEDFKQLVQSAFFKFLKQINETPMKRKKYKEQGKASNLKCIVCGSNSDEFAGTESLAMHAFTSKTVGLRSQHLGFHKALCALMGWKIPEGPSSEWHCELMSNGETSALKEDLIIWPPVIIVHNCTIDDRSPDERVIISTERLDTKLRDMGFGSILKVCHGKPANQSVMVVKFSGTLSGLQEAKRLHQSYAESNHSRAQLLQLKKSENKSSKEGKRAISAEKEDNFLYGHLGIAEDLDKLDFDTKKRCVLRSKKQILSIADVPVDT